MDHRPHPEAAHIWCANLAAEYSVSTCNKLARDPESHLSSHGVRRPVTEACPRQSGRRLHPLKSRLVALGRRGDRALACAASACPAAFSAAATGRGTTTFIAVGDATLTTLTHDNAELRQPQESGRLCSWFSACGKHLGVKLRRMQCATYKVMHTLGTADCKAPEEAAALAIGNINETFSRQIVEAASRVALRYDASPGALATS